MYDLEHISDQYDIGYENSFELEEYLQCLGELEWEIMNYQRLIWIKSELFLRKSEMMWLLSIELFDN